MIQISTLLKDHHQMALTLSILVQIIQKRIINKVHKSRQKSPKINDPDFDLVEWSHQMSMT